MITPTQEQVLALISAGSTISEAAASAGIHRNTVHNWLRSAPQFRLALAQAREAKALYWREQAEELAASALDTIRGLMTDPAVAASVRLKAARFILDLAAAPPVMPAESLHNSAQAAPPSVPLELPQPVAETPKFVHNSAEAKQSHSASTSGTDPQTGCPGDPTALTYAPVPFRREGPRTGRNDACPCGSGKKFKRCCLGAPAALAS